MQSNAITLRVAVYLIRLKAAQVYGATEMVLLLLRKLYNRLPMRRISILIAIVKVQERGITMY